MLLASAPVHAQSGDAASAKFTPAPAPTAHEQPVSLPGTDGAPDACAAPADSSADPVELARSWFEQGIAYVESNAWAQAETCFRRVLTVRSSAVVSYNLASALARLGRLVESAELLRVVVRDPALDASIRTPAEQLLAEVEPKIGSLTVRVSGELRDVSLRLDERALGASKPVQALSVDPGTHIVVAERDGAKLATAHVEIGGDAPLKVEVTLDLTETRPPPQKPDPRVALLPSEQMLDASRKDEASGNVLASPWLWTGIGVGVVAVAATIVAVAVGGGGGGTQDPVSGDTEPPVIRGRVEVP